MFSTLKNYSDKSLTRSDPTSNKTNLKVNKLSQKTKLRKLLCKKPMLVENALWLDL